MSRHVRDLANNSHLIKVANAVKLDTFLSCGSDPANSPPTSPKAGVRSREKKRLHTKTKRGTHKVVFSWKVMADTVEAVIGAAFLDGGLSAAGDVVVALKLDKEEASCSRWAEIKKRYDHPRYSSCSSPEGRKDARN
jgi:dsRNA-specific ribonuclease